VGGALGPVKQIAAGLLDVGYVDVGPRDGPAVVLLHGWPYDIHTFAEVSPLLAAAGYRVIVPYLRGYVARSYGGAVISNAATGLANVVGLVFVAAFAPDEGERLGEVTTGSRDSVLGTAQVALQYPNPDGAGTTSEFAIDPAKLHDVFAADLPARQAAVLAATQRPVSELAFTEPSGPPAWKSLPSWTVLASPDKAAGTDVVRSMAERAGATITEVEGSHVIMISRPDVVADVIKTAAAAVGRSVPATVG
jgi:pimeloyl-ACP methyl ester carboxylesterase